MMVASMVILRARITFVNISSHMVQVLGFIRLGRTPNARNGTESTPRIGTGTCICSQHPLQILDCSNSAIVSSGSRERGLILLAGVGASKAVPYAADRRRNGEVVLYAFDPIEQDGDELRDLPLIERKRLLPLPGEPISGCMIKF